LDAWAAVAQNLGLDFSYSDDGVPEWAASDPTTCKEVYSGGPASCSSTVADIQDWDDYVTALATNYKGKIRIYELWNEPNGSFTGTTAEMVTLRTHMYEIIRHIDPAAFTLPPSPSTSGVIGSYLDSYFAAGGPTGVDGISFHTYTATPENVVGHVSDIKQIAAKYSLASKPLWNTEGSWGTRRLTSAAQVAAVARFYLRLWSGGVSRFYWYAWDGGT